MFSLNSSVETVPPQRPGLDVLLMPAKQQQQQEQQEEKKQNGRDFTLLTGLDVGWAGPVDWLATRPDVVVETP